MTSYGIFPLLTQECEIKEEGKTHFLILHNCRLDQTGGVDFQAANVKSSAHQRRMTGEGERRIKNIVLILPSARPPFSLTCRLRAAPSPAGGGKDRLQSPFAVK